MDLLFWSGGKDAYLALLFYRQDHPESDIKLLTTYEEESEVVPHQNIDLSHIREQADWLGLELLTVPLPKDCPNDKYLSSIKKMLSEEASVDNLLFGDWYLEDIREWREEKFGEMGYSCLFPIWKKDLHELLSALLLQPVKVEISNVQDEFKDLIRVGETFDQNFVTQIQRLDEGIDPMGENGEFHTRLIFEDLDEKVDLQLQKGI